MFLYVCMVITITFFLPVRVHKTHFDRSRLLKVKKLFMLSQFTLIELMFYVKRQPNMLRVIFSLNYYVQLVEM